jgi:iron complex outermembrane receptor protein
MLSLPTLVATISTPAFADDDVLDEVIVTAQYIKEDAQKTAVSMEVLSTEKLSEAGITSVIEVARFTPGLQLEQAGGGLTATVRIRGIGTPGFSPLDPSVPIFIDGIAQARTGAGFQDLLDVSRIEILRGPQGTLYGRNSTAGAINIWTKDANTHRWEGSAEVEGGNYDRRSIKGTLNIPLAEDLLAARLSAYSVKQDGYVTNAYTGTTGIGDADRYGARAKIGITPIDAVDIQWVTDYSKSTTHPLDALDKIPTMYNLYVAAPTSTPAPGFPIQATEPGGIESNPRLPGIPVNSRGLPIAMPIDDKYNGNVWRNTDAIAIDTNFDSSVKLAWKISDSIALTSITGFARNKTNQMLDLDHSILDWYLTHGITITDSSSQELRLSRQGEHIDYVVGAYYSMDKVDSINVTNGSGFDKRTAAGYDNGLDELDDNYVAIPGRRIPFDPFQPNAVRPAGGFPLEIGSNAIARSVTNLGTKFRALFGQLTYKLGPVSLTGGLRRTWVEKSGNTDLYLASGSEAKLDTAEKQAPLIDHLVNKYLNTSGVFKVRYFATDDTMIYVSYDKGFKPGGYNRKVSVAPIPTTYDSENSNNYEVGLKSSWLNRHLQTNVSVFYLTFNGFHNQTFTSNSDLVIENLKKVVSKGVEADLQALLTKGLTVGAGFAYLDPRVADPYDENTGLISAVYKTRDQRLFDVSQRNVNINADYSHPLSTSAAEGFVRVDWSWRSAYGISEPNYGVEQSPVALTNIRLGVRHLADHWQIAAWAKNVFDKEYASSGSSMMGGFPNAAGLDRNDGHFITQGAPRTFGMTVQYDF